MTKGTITTSIETTMFRSKTHPERYRRPAHAHIRMLNPEGSIRNVVVATATKEFDDINPDNNTYGNTIIEELERRCWLRMDECPLKSGGANPFTTEGPCADGKSCTHLPKIEEARKAAHLKAEDKFASNERKKEEAKLKRQAAANVTADAVKQALASSNKDEVARLKDELDAAKKGMAEQAELMRQFMAQQDETAKPKKRGRPRKSTSTPKEDS